MRYKANLKSIQVNMGKYKKLLHVHFSEAITDAAILWMQTVLSEIPVWSGASRATFTKLARDAEYALNISPTVNSRIPLGVAHGDGEITGNRDTGKYSFHYETSLPHLIYNEFNNANKVGFRLINPGPYHFQELGQAALERFEVTLPDLRQAIVMNTYKV